MNENKTPQDYRKEALRLYTSGRNNTDSGSYTFYADEYRDGFDVHALADTIYEMLGEYLLQYPEIYEDTGEIILDYPAYAFIFAEDLDFKEFCACVDDYFCGEAPEDELTVDAFAEAIKYSLHLNSIIEQYRKELYE